MSISHADLSGKKTVKEKIIPRAGRSVSVPARRQEAGGAAALGIRYSPPVRQEPESEDAKSVDLFLETLGRILHEVCGKKAKQLFLSPDEIEEIYMHTVMSLNPPKKNFKISSTWHDTVARALTRIPIALLAEKDPDHTYDTPDITELLALEEYTRKYERTDPDGNMDAPLFNHHRGEFGQPDFVYRTEENRVMRRYDPLQLSRDNSRDGRKRWLVGAYDKHAEGKGAGAVCILDVSAASREQIRDWIRIFRTRLWQIREPDRLFQDPDQLPPELVRLCNTYVVSYGGNADSNGVRELQGIFDEARSFLERHGRLGLLEEWRTGSVDPVLKDDMGGFGDLFGGL